jgi:murein DD-endopeptidase MepM/ murein hydrolase activator NlpD
MLRQLLSTVACGFLLAMAASISRGQEEKHAVQYVLTYPQATQFCLPVASYLEDVSEAIQKVGSRTFRHQLNGGYGLPVVDTVGGKHLLHLGADVAWMRLGAPVYAMADGVVRISDGPPPDKDKRADVANDKNARPEPTESMGWGNLIAIEHHLPDDSYVTSVYGHLASERFVAAGEVVKAGQVIGTIGKMGAENGGFMPHLHFALRKGRTFEPGSTLLQMRAGGQPCTIKLGELNDEEVELKSDSNLPTSIDLSLNGKDFAITSRNGKHYLPAAALNHLQPSSFAIVGYALSTDGWLDPTQFLGDTLNKYPRASFGEMPARTKLTTAKSR